MWQSIYLKRLKQDLEKWVERGWVTPANAQSILLDASGGAVARHVPQILAIMGAVLVGFAAMSFVAANWADIPKFIRLLMIFSALWVAWGAAFFTERRGMTTYAEAAVVAGLALFGANIMLIAQIYHVSSSTPTWVLLWSLVSLAAAWALPSRAALAITFLLAIIWSAWADQSDTSIHWAFIVPWALTTWLTARLSWRPGVQLALLSAWVWAGINASGLQAILGCGQGDLTALFALVALVQWAAGLRIGARSLRFGPILETYGMVITFALLWSLQLQAHDTSAGFIWAALALLCLAGVGALAYAEVAATRLVLRDYAGLVALGLGAAFYPLIGGHESLNLIVYAALFLTLTVWLVAYGTSRNNRFAINAGLVAFTGECLYLYFQTLGTLLGTATFFALGGVILIAGSILLPRLRRRLVDATKQGDIQ